MPGVLFVYRAQQPIPSVIPHSFVISSFDPECLSVWWERRSVVYQRNKKHLWLLAMIYTKKPNRTQSFDEIFGQKLHAAQYSNMKIYGFYEAKCCLLFVVTKYDVRSTGHRIVNVLLANVVFLLCLHLFVFRISNERHGMAYFCPAAFVLRTQFYVVARRNAIGLMHFACVTGDRWLDWTEACALNNRQNQSGKYNKKTLLNRVRDRKLSFIVCCYIASKWKK